MTHLHYFTKRIIQLPKWQLVVHADASSSGDFLTCKFPRSNNWNIPGEYTPAHTFNLLVSPGEQNGGKVYLCNWNMLKRKDKYYHIYKEKQTTSVRRHIDHHRAVFS